MCGVLPINKPSGITSFGVVAKIKKITGEKHVGHTGTLDPMASGVLPVLIGRATKLCDFMLSADKCYNATVKLGTVTDTLDIEGNVLYEKSVDVTDALLDKTLPLFLGEGEQIPPMFSAIKKDGVRLYRLARQGKEVNLEPRKINVFKLNRISDLNENFEFQISCRVSKGTYIRALVRDIGEKLGTGAVLTALSRTHTAGFDLSECVSLDMLNGENIKDSILPASRAVSSLRDIPLTENQAFRFSNGGSLSFDRLPIKEYGDGELVRLSFENEFLGVACADSAKRELKLKCIINPVGRVI